MESRKYHIYRFNNLTGVFQKGIHFIFIFIFFNFCLVSSLQNRTLELVYDINLVSSTSVDKAIFGGNCQLLQPYRLTLSDTYFISINYRLLI